MLEFTINAKLTKHYPISKVFCKLDKRQIFQLPNNLYHHSAVRDLCHNRSFINFELFENYSISLSQYKMLKRINSQSLWVNGSYF